MFDSYVSAKTNKARKWVAVTISVSVVAHAVAIAFLVIRGYWTIDKITPEKRDDDTIAFYDDPPPPPPPPPGGAKQKKVEKVEIKKTKVTETTQEEKKEDKPKEETNDKAEQGGVAGGVEGGVEGGVLGGVLGGVEGGVLGGTGTGPPPPPPKAKMVAPSVLKAQLVSGTEQINMPKKDLVALRTSGKKQAVTVAKLCVSGGGKITSVSIIRSSGYKAHDRKIRATLKKNKYRPVRVGGKAVPVCSTVTIINRM